MTITVESTDKIVSLDGVDARIWEGHTASGIALHVYITRVAVSTAQGIEHAEFERELRETRSPSPAIAAIPLRMIL